MKYSYTWLKELSKTKKSPKELAELLTMRAFELEEMKTEGKETQLEFSILPNRAHDALSHIGIAREICAVEGRRFIIGGSTSIREVKPPSGRLKVDVKEKNLCPRYMVVFLENIKIIPSPRWMQERLLACGLKPINNIVDITNYVMLETGQPLHAFDFSKIKSEFPISNFQFPNKSQNPKSKIQIIIRKAKKNEEIKLLDEKVYKLSEIDLVIAGSEKPIALAGVMGGFDSSITNKTTSIILESANFNSTSVRRTRVAHNIITESSHRFEREIDPNLAEMAMSRAIELLKKFAGKGLKIAGATDVYPKKIKPWKIILSTEYANNLLGENIPVAKMKNILENLGLGIKSAKNVLNCEIPTIRIDLKTQEDLIEEIGRIYGYENIKEQALVSEVKTPPQNEKRNFENNLRDILIGLGFSEVMNYSFYGADDIAKCNLKIEDHIEVSNPLSSEQQYLRSDLVPGIIKNVALNLKYLDSFSIFEIGNVFSDSDSKDKEKTILAGTLANKNSKKSLFFQLKGKIEELFRLIDTTSIEIEQPKVVGNFMHPSRTAVIKMKNKVVGFIGELNPSVLRKYGIKEKMVVFELDLSDLQKNSQLNEKQYLAIAKFPFVERDLSMFIGKDTKYSDIEASIGKSGSNFVKNINLFDVFEKEGEKSLALRLKLGSDSKTLTAAEIDAVMQKIISALEKDLKVKVRK